MVVQHFPYFRFSCLSSFSLRCFASFLLTNALPSLASFSFRYDFDGRFLLFLLVVPTSPAATDWKVLSLSPSLADQKRRVEKWRLREPHFFAFFLFETVEVTLYFPSFSRCSPCSQPFHGHGRSSSADSFLKLTLLRSVERLSPPNQTTAFLPSDSVLPQTLTPLTPIPFLFSFPLQLSSPRSLHPPSIIASLSSKGTNKHAHGRLVDLDVHRPSSQDLSVGGSWVLAHQERIVPSCGE